MARFISAGGPLAPAVIEDRLDREMDMQRTHSCQYWPVFLREEGTHVGCCGLRAYRPEQGIPELGVHIRPPFWRRGFGSEAAEAVIAHAFEHLGVAGLFAGHNPANAPSRSMLLKLGFSHTHDEFYPPTGLQHPSYLLTREVWQLRP